MKDNCLPRCTGLSDWDRLTNDQKRATRKLRQHLYNYFLCKRHNPLLRLEWNFTAEVLFKDKKEEKNA